MKTRARQWRIAPKQQFLISDLRAPVLYITPLFSVPMCAKRIFRCQKKTHLSLSFEILSFLVILSLFLQGMRVIFQVALALLKVS